MSSSKWRTILLNLSGQPKLPRFSTLPSSRRCQRPLSGLETLCRNFNSVLDTLPGVAVQQTASCWQFHSPSRSHTRFLGSGHRLKKIARDDYERNPSVIAARLPVSLSRTEVNNGGFHKVLKNDFLLPLGLKKARGAYVMALVLPPWRLRQVWNLIRVLFLLKFFGKSAKDLFYLYWRPTSNGLNVDGLGRF